MHPPYALHIITASPAGSAERCELQAADCLWTGEPASCCECWITARLAADFAVQGLLPGKLLQPARGWNFHQAGWHTGGEIIKGVLIGSSGSLRSLARLLWHHVQHQGSTHMPAAKQAASKRCRSAGLSPAPESPPSPGAWPPRQTYAGAAPQAASICCQQLPPTGPQSGVRCLPRMSDAGTCSSTSKAIGTGISAGTASLRGTGRGASCS